MLPGASNRLSWARSEKLNQFLNLSSFAEQMLVHENAIVKIRKDMPLELAALIGCGVITGYGAVVNTAKVAPGESVVVIGCGGIGMAAHQRRAQIAGAAALARPRSTPIRLNCSFLRPGLGATGHRRSQERRRGAAGARSHRRRRASFLRSVLGRARKPREAFAMLAPATIVGITIPFGQKIELHPALISLRERKI